LKLYIGGYLAFFSPNQQSEVELTLSEPVKLDVLLAEAGIPAAEVQLVLINGTRVDSLQSVVQNQDEVKIFPGVDGG
jgi:sulfur carrier protein ThiS